MPPADRPPAQREAIYGCEWCPEADRAAWRGDKHHETTAAVWCIGHRGDWHVCDSCSRLPRFRRFKRRVQLTAQRLAQLTALDAEAARPAQGGR